MSIIPALENWGEGSRDWVHSQPLSKTEVRLDDVRSCLKNQANKLRIWNVIT